MFNMNDFPVDLIEDNHLLDPKYTGEKSIKKTLLLLESVNCVVNHEKSSDPAVINTISSIIKNQKNINQLIHTNSSWDFDLIGDKEQEDSVIYTDTESDIQSLLSDIGEEFNMETQDDVSSHSGDDQPQFTCPDHPDNACGCSGLIDDNDEMSQVQGNDGEENNPKPVVPIYDIPSGLRTVAGCKEMAQVMQGAVKKTKIKGPSKDNVVKGPEVKVSARTTRIRPSKKQPTPVVPVYQEIPEGNSTGGSNSPAYLTPNPSSSSGSQGWRGRSKFTSPQVNPHRERANNEIFVDKTFTVSDFHTDLISDFQKFEEIMEELKDDYTKDAEIKRQMIKRSFSKIYQSLRTEATIEVVLSRINHVEKVVRAQSKSQAALTKAMEQMTREMELMGRRWEQAFPITESKRDRSQSRGRSQVRFREPPMEPEKPKRRRGFKEPDWAKKVDPSQPRGQETQKSIVSKSVNRSSSSNRGERRRPTEMTLEEAIKKYDQIKRSVNRSTKLHLLIAECNIILKIMAENNQELAKQVDEDTLLRSTVSEVLDEMDMAKSFF